MGLFLLILLTLLTLILYFAIKRFEIIEDDIRNIKQKLINKF